MLTKKQVEDSIDAMQMAVDYNISALLSAARMGTTSVHRVLAQAPSLSYALTSLSQLQDLLVDMEIAEEDAAQGGVDTPVENAFAKRMREAREAAQARKQEQAASKKR